MVDGVTVHTAFWGSGNTRSVLPPIGVCYGRLHYLSVFDVIYQEVQLDAQTSLPLHPPIPLSIVEAAGNLGVCCACI